MCMATQGSAHKWPRHMTLHTHSVADFAPCTFRTPSRQSAADDNTDAQAPATYPTVSPDLDSVFTAAITDNELFPCSKTFI